MATLSKTATKRITSAADTRAKKVASKTTTTFKKK